MEPNLSITQIHACTKRFIKNEIETIKKKKNNNVVASLPMHTHVYNLDGV